MQEVKTEGSEIARVKALIAQAHAEMALDSIDRSVNPKLDPNRRLKAWILKAWLTDREVLIAAIDNAAKSFAGGGKEKPTESQP